MIYKALKPCEFDRKYYIGDTINEGAVADDTAQSLIAMGLITLADGNTAEKVGQVAAEAQQPADVEPEIEDNADLEQEPEVEPSGQKYTKRGLTDKKKADLIELAKGLQLPVTDDMTKDEIADAILLLQATA